MAHKVKSLAYVYIYGFLLSFSGWFFGYQIGLFNSFFKFFMPVVYPEIVDEKNKQEIQENLQMYLMIGGTVSCLTAGYIVDTLGRYRSVLLYLTAELCVLLISLDASLNVLYTVRFLNGFIACSWTFLGPIMIKEIIPPAYKNLFGGLFYIFITLGILSSYTFGYESIAAHWRYVFLLPAVFDLPKLLAFIFVFRIESPIWICTKIENIEQRQQMVQNNLGKIYDDSEIEKMTNLIVNESGSSGKTKEIAYGDLIGPEYILQFLVVLLLNFLNQMTGINLLMFYSEKLFTDMQFSNSVLITIFMGLSNTVGAITITIISQKISKKFGIVAGLGLQSFGYFTFLLGKELDIIFMVIGGIFTYIFSFAISLGGLLYSYQTDVLPAKGIGIASIIQWILATLIGKFSPSIILLFGDFYVFLFFMVTSCIGAILFAGYGIDTERKSDSQIKEEFMGKTFMS